MKSQLREMIREEIKSLNENSGTPKGTITIRFNERRYVASFDDMKSFVKFIKTNDLKEKFMYTVHIGNKTFNLDKVSDDLPKHLKLFSKINWQ